MRKQAILLLATLCCQQAFSQSDDVAYPHVTVMSPEAAALAKHADIPVSYYTGVPNISIPIYTIKVDNFEMPLTLSYHSSGIRVDQEATWVGLGWNLNVGGRISRTVRCVDDFIMSNNDPSHPYIKNGYYNAPDFNGNYLNLYEAIGGDPNMLRQVVDSEPDIFYYDIPGYSGKFIIDKKRGAILFDKSHNLKIEVIKVRQPYCVHFKITDSDGNQYLFADIEHSKNYTSNGYLNKNIITSTTKYDSKTSTFIEWIPVVRLSDDDDGYQPGPCNPYNQPSSWCLTKITTRSGREITFTYTKEEQYLPTQESCEVYNSQWGSSQIFSKSKVVNQAWRLTRIEWDFGYITFLCNNKRKDINGDAKRLDALCVYDKSNAQFYACNFAYSYFDNDYNGSSDYEHVFKRLKLVSVSKPGSEKYKFSYYEGLFPAKNSKDVDYWGQQNGCTYGKGYYVGIWVGNTKYKGVRKDANFEYSKIGMLKEIEYPTGGFSRFTYEPHKFYAYYQYHTNDDLTAEKNGSTTPSYATYHIGVCNNYQVNEHPELEDEQTLTFTTTGTTQVTIEGHLENYNCEYRDPTYNYNDEITHPLAYLKRTSPTTQTYARYGCPFVYDAAPGERANGEGCEVDVITHSYSLPAGTYTFKACCPPRDVNADWTITIDQKVRPGTTSGTYEYGAGLRIAKIETNTSVRKFNYSIGKILVEPTLYYYGNRVGDGSHGGQCVVQVSESRTPLSTFNNGNTVGYEWVEEVIASNDQISRIRHHYYNNT